MAIVYFINRPKSQALEGLLFVLRYTMQDKKTVAKDGVKYVSGVNCTPQSAYTEFNNTKKLHGKTEGRQYYHFVQSFPVGENITPKTAHEIALQFAQEAEKFHGFEIVISTHCDRDYIHSHFVMNSVNADTGKKFHISESEVEMLMQVSDKICRAYGLSVIEPKPKNERAKPMSDREYRSAVKGDSWKIQLEAVISNAMKTSSSKEHFILLMESEGYKVKWTEERKYITYTTPDGKHCRDSKLHLQKFLKENMEYEFYYRAQISARFYNSGTTTVDRRRKGSSLHGGNRAELASNDIYAESTNRTAERDSKHPAYAYNRKETEGIYESAVGGPNGIHRGNHNGDRGVSEFNDSDGKEYVVDNPTDSYRDRTTGWESERELFKQALYGRRSDGTSHEQDVLDFAGTGSNTDHIGIDTAYLVGNIGNIIDGDAPVEDCTTKHYPAERKKNHDPVMGGM